MTAGGAAYAVTTWCGLALVAIALTDDGELWKRVAGVIVPSAYCVRESGAM